MALASNNVFGSCMVNEDWPDAPCMDQIDNDRYPQEEVDRWADYYDYKGEEIMLMKQAEMNQAIQNNELEQWVDESIQNNNAYTYFYFSGEAPNLPNNREYGFDSINGENKSIQKLVSTNNPYSNDPQMWILTGTIASIVGVSSVIVWRSRK